MQYKKISANLILEKEISKIETCKYCAVAI